jgi:cyanate lyase
MCSREAAVDRILAAKRATGLSFETLAADLGVHEVWLATALLGHATMNREDSERVSELLGLDPDVTVALQEIPSRDDLSTGPPPDPLLYRFFEILGTFGPAMKAVIEERLGDGVMSAMDFTLDVARRPHPCGDRVVVTFDGRFLPHRKWCRAHPGQGVAP